MIPISREDLVVMMEGGHLYLRMGRFEEAKEVFEGVSVLTPQSEVPLVAMGSVFFAQMKYDQAIRHYRKAVTLKPDSPYARSFLGESLFFKGRNEEALAELQKAIDLDLQGDMGGGFARSLIDAIQKGFDPPGRFVHH
ncbi:MAG: tetratricopeptide repeat protein [Deltaproteobacteria bacterium]|nr:tetratricopeptide repeat protein [Deltaproteobacteria bacterium]